MLHWWNQIQNWWPFYLSVLGSFTVPMKLNATSWSSISLIEDFQPATVTQFFSLYRRCLIYWVFAECFACCSSNIIFFTPSIFIICFLLHILQLDRIWITSTSTDSTYVDESFLPALYQRPSYYCLSLSFFRKKIDFSYPSHQPKNINSVSLTTYASWNVGYFLPFYCMIWFMIPGCDQTFCCANANYFYTRFSFEHAQALL